MNTSQRAPATAGVRTGRLPEVLATLNSYARTMADLRTLVAGALYYPWILMLLGLGLFLLVALTVALYAADRNFVGIVLTSLAALICRFRA